MIAIIRTRTLRALRADLAYTESCNEAERAETGRQARAAELATDAAIRAEAAVEMLRTALAEAQADAASARGALAVLETQHQLDTEDRVALRMLLRATRQRADRADRVYVLFRCGRLHGVYATQDAAEIAAEAEGAPRTGWTSALPGAALPAERAAALDVLGYVVEDDARWSSWMLGRHRVWSAPIRPLGSHSTVVPEGQMAFWGEGR